MFQVSLDNAIRQKQLVAYASILTVAVLGAAAVHWDTQGFPRLIFLTILQVTPFFICVANSKIDYLSIILGGEFVGYSLSPLIDYLIDPAHATLSVHASQAVEMLTWSTVLILFVFYGGRFLIKSKPNHYKHFNLIPFSMRQAAALGAALLFSYVISPYIPDDLQEFFLSCQFLLTCLVFCIGVQNGKWLLRALHFCVFVGVFYSFLLYTNLGFAINLLVIWICQLVLERNGKLLLKLSLLLSYMVCLQAVKYDYRTTISYEPTLGLVDRSKLLVKLIEARFLPKKRGPSYLAFNAALDRAHDESLERVIEWTPSKVPYWEGKSFLNLPYLLVPRFLWPSKPNWNLWNEFGHRYGYLQQNDTSTIVLFSYFAEGYMNFGKAGLFLMALFVGTVFILIEKLSHSRYSFTFIVLLMPLLAYQTDIGSLLVRWIYVAIIVLPLRKFSRVFQSEYRESP